MIPSSFITAWRFHNPWPSDAQVEQDLVICRALVEIYKTPYLQSTLALGGGTALYKLHIKPPVRYSEDIDLVQVKAESAGDTIDSLRSVLDPWLGVPKRERAENSFKLIYQFDSESDTSQKMKLKIEVNTREHFSIMGYQYLPVKVNSNWFSGTAAITTFAIEELLSTKMRALYQRKKGRDLLDLWLAASDLQIDRAKLISTFKEYIRFQGLNITRTQFLDNLRRKKYDLKFKSDSGPILAANFEWDMETAMNFVESELISILPD